MTNIERHRKYWRDLKAKLKKGGCKLSEQIGQLKMKSADCKNYPTYMAETKQLFPLIQSIPSAKADPFKSNTQRI